MAIVLYSYFDDDLQYGNLPQYCLHMWGFSGPIIFSFARVPQSGKSRDNGPHANRQAWSNLIGNRGSCGLFRHIGCEVACARGQPSPSHRRLSQQRCSGHVQDPTSWACCSCRGDSRYLNSRHEVNEICHANRAHHPCPADPYLS